MCVFLSLCELHEYQKMKMNESKGCHLRNDLRAGWLSMISLRSLQMCLIYVFVSVATSDSRVEWLNAKQVLTFVIVFFSLDIAVCLTLSSAMRRVLFVTMLCWFLFSRESILFRFTESTWISQRSLFESTVLNSDNEYVLIWFDVILGETVFGVSALILLLHQAYINRVQIALLFIQFVDLATDLTVCVYWIGSGAIVWCVFELLFIVSCAIVQWRNLRKHLESPMDHILTLLGMARGLTKVKHWNATENAEKWLRIDEKVSEIEIYYESYPSLMLGLLIVATSGGSSSFGPLIISIAITALSVGFKTIQKAEYDIINPRMIWFSFFKDDYSKRQGLLLRITLFLLFLTDFVCRSVPLICLWSVAQYARDEDNVNELTLPFLCVFPISLLFVLAVEFLSLLSAINPLRIVTDRSKVNAIKAIKSHCFPMLFTVAPLFYGSFGLRKSVKSFYRFDAFYHAIFVRLIIGLVFMFTVLLFNQFDTFMYRLIANLYFPSLIVHIFIIFVYSNFVEYV